MVQHARHVVQLWLRVLHNVRHLLKQDAVLPLDFSVPLFHESLFLAVSQATFVEAKWLRLILLSDGRLHAPELPAMNVLFLLLPSLVEVLGWARLERKTFH